MRYLLVTLCLLLLPSCTTKPWIYAANVQPEAVTVQMLVVYDDYDEAEVVDAVNAAIVEFAYRTRIIIDVTEYRKIDWVSRDWIKMSEQTVRDGGYIEQSWVLMIYKKTALEWVLLPILGNCEGAAEQGGHWAFVNRLSKDLIVHELYHLGYGIEKYR